MRQRAYSIRTRIKTRIVLEGVINTECQRAYSIRTRIKTTESRQVVVFRDSVREHIPLEQGLRLLSTLRPRGIELVREHIPLEQGLRLELGSGVKHRIVLSESIFH